MLPNYIHIKYLIEFMQYFGNEFLRSEAEKPQRIEHTFTCLD
jgi:hypothetical protein